MKKNIETVEIIRFLSKANDQLLKGNVMCKEEHEKNVDSMCKIMMKKIPVTDTQKKLIKSMIRKNMSTAKLRLCMSIFELNFN